MFELSQACRGAAVPCQPEVWRTVAVLAFGSLALAGCGSSADSTAAHLAAKGYSVTAEHWCRAACSGDVEALRLFARTSVATQSLVLDGDRFCLEAALVGQPRQRADIGAVLDELKPGKKVLNRAYASSTGKTAQDVPDADQLARAAGHRATSLFAGGRVIEATPLMWAVWANDAAAVQALLDHGADPNLRSHIPIMVGAALNGGKAQLSSSELVRIAANPLFEALRLRRDPIAQLLTRHGAKPHVSSSKPIA